MPNWIHVFLPLVLWFFHGLVDSWFLPILFAQTPELTLTEPSSPSQPIASEFPTGFLVRPLSGGAPVSALTLSTQVTIAISGLVVRTTVSQTFHNSSSEWAEGMYVFPLPERAAVDHLRMKIGERVIEGIIKERSEAKKTYEQAKRHGQQSSLLEQERPNVFTASAANLPPGEPIIVDIEFQDTVRYDQGRFSIRFPTVVGPRYIPGSPLAISHIEFPLHNRSGDPTGMGWSVNTDQVTDASRITPPVLHPKHRPLNPLHLTIDLAPGFLLDQVDSPTHPIHVTTQSNGTSRITLAGKTTYADRDFELIWTPQSANHPQTTLFTEEHGGQTYGLLFFLPPQVIETAPGDIPREVVFVIDTSGSMAGASIVQAKAALKLAIQRLTSKDRFNIIQFNSLTQRLFPEARWANPQAIHTALSYVDGLQGEGGTEMLPAVIQALSGQKEGNHLRQVIFITDGLIGNENALFTAIQNLLGHSRLFTVGIGSAPNGHFMRRAAQNGRGTFTYIGTTHEVREKMQGLFAKLEQPAFLNLALSLPPQDKKDLLPDPLPDVYAGEPLMVTLRTSALPDHLTVSGTHGRFPWSTKVPLSSALSRKGIAVHWARQKIAQLMDLQTQGSNHRTVRQHIVDLALHHHLVSRFTSLVAVEAIPARPTNIPLHAHALKTNLPNGMEYEAIFGWPRTATPSALYGLLGLLLLGTAGLLFLYPTKESPRT